MSLANFYNQTAGSIQFGETQQNTLTIVGQNGKKIMHRYDADGNYDVIDGDNRQLLSFNATGTMEDCTVKTHVQTSIAPVLRTTATHTAKLNEHETRLVNVEGFTGGQDVTAMENRIDDLEAYQAKLKSLFAVFKNSVTIDGVNFNDLL